MKLKAELTLAERIGQDLGVNPNLVIGKLRSSHCANYANLADNRVPDYSYQHTSWEFKRNSIWILNQLATAKTFPPSKHTLKTQSISRTHSLRYQRITLVLYCESCTFCKENTAILNLGRLPKSYTMLVSRLGFNTAKLLQRNQLCKNFKNTKPVINQRSGVKAQNEVLGTIIAFNFLATSTSICSYFCEQFVFDKARNNTTYVLYGCI